MRTFTTTFSVFDSKKKTIWEDTEAHETKLVTVFIKEVSIDLRLLRSHVERKNTFSERRRRRILLLPRDFV